MNDRWKNIMIGSFVAAALGIGVALVFFLKPTIGDGKNSLKVCFINVAGINTGTRVTYAGKPVGEVAKIKPIPNARTEALDEIGRVYSYQLTLIVDSSISVYTSDEIAIRTTGLMGEKSIAIIPKAPPQGETPHLAFDTILFANSTDPLENTINQIGKVAAKAEGSIDRFDEWFKQNAPALSHTALNLGNAAHSLDTVLTTVHTENIIPTLKNSLDLVSDNMEMVRSSLTNDELLGRLATLISHLTESSAVFNTDGAAAMNNLKEITHDIATGSGTMGRFVKGDDFYLRLNSLMSKSETLMNDVNHYGLLFQYDKHWQRSRTKKANILKALDTPDEFKTYFEGEIDSINTSLGRITELLDRAGQDPEREKIVQSENFVRDFASLMRQVQSLSDSLKLYNQELVAKMEPE